MSIPLELQDLAPKDLIIYRTNRYEGGGFNVSLKDFVPEDAALLIRVYNVVKKLYDLWLYMKDDPNYDLLRSQIIKELGAEQFRTTAQAIGSTTYAIDDPSPLLRKVIHDVRGGALSVLIGLASFLRLDPSDTHSIDQAVTLARDHAKLMRNAIEDIDPVVRMADESLKVHPISDFVTKWRDLSFDVAKKAVLVEVDCTFEGNITSRCLETSAIDRILYNYINNAARFTVDKKVKLTIFATNDVLVRWVIENKISQQQKNWLRETVGENLGALFEGGVTRGGHGIGLSSCTDFVAASFGVETNPQAIEAGYIGAKVIDDKFCAWFHWPIYYPAASDPVCGCST